MQNSIKYKLWKVCNVLRDFRITVLQTSVLLSQNTSNNIRYSYMNPFQLYDNDYNTFRESCITRSAHMKSYYLR